MVRSIVLLISVIATGCGDKSTSPNGLSDVDVDALISTIDNGKSQVQLRGLIDNGSIKKGSSTFETMDAYQFDVKPSADVAIRLDTDDGGGSYCVYKVIGGGLDFKYMRGSCNEVSSREESNLGYKSTDTIQLEEATYFIVLEDMDGNYELTVAW